jgi:hypothetical protein
LRRVWQKRPLFTQGSAEAIEDVLDQARVGDQGEFAHGVAGPRPGLRPLDAGEREALAAFVQLL